ncbi:TrmH family RNA methyltransferase [Desertivirga brevis]|uniref:TrmH family RNA methyltransferase n=1 Tax=Desertivirga brevis TaxID=2810310 RepID=UPI001A965DE4|nr:RNA methyltransferase [Pedobacter sp. SYSU D00873]
MLSKSQISFVNALQQKKQRKEQGLFIAEGVKSITEFLNSDYTVSSIYCTADYLERFSKLTQKVKIHEVTDAEIKKLSALTTPQHALALVEIPEKTAIVPESFKGKFSLVLDGIQDPGNMGTIIRTADWFGFEDIICSNDTVDVFNPKVVQATMGSLSRVRVTYLELQPFLAAVKLPVYGALLDGENIYTKNFKEEGLVILGNEGKGISTQIIAEVTESVTIPRFGKAESLNVAIAASIFCSEIRRKSFDIKR